MIRELQKTDIDTVSQIWLDANRDAHDSVLNGKNIFACHMPMNF